MTIATEIRQDIHKTCLSLDISHEDDVQEGFLTPLSIAGDYTDMFSPNNSEHVFITQKETESISWLATVRKYSTVIAAGVAVGAIAAVLIRTRKHS